MKQTLSVTVRGHRKAWCFDFEGDPKYLAEWRADGLEVDEIANTIPMLAARRPLLTIWIAVQDAWRWMRLW